MLGLPGSGIGPLHPPCFLYECKFTLNLVSVIVQGGNNNTYCHDSELNWFNWEQAIHDDTGYARFFRCLVNLRLVPGTVCTAGNGLHIQPTPFIRRLQYMSHCSCCC